MAKPNIGKAIKRLFRWLWTEHKDDIADVVIKEAEKVKQPKG